MKFLQLFLIYMLVKGESDFECWQSEAFVNEERVAEKAYDESIRLIRDGRETTLKEWAYEIINEMYGMCEVLGINDFSTLNFMLNRISNPDLTYGKRLLKLIEKDGYINTHVILSKNNKQTSINNVENFDRSNCRDLEKYVNVALGGK
jgi:glutamate--cysteine ligase